MSELNKKVRRTKEMQQPDSITILGALNSSMLRVFFDALCGARNWSTLCASDVALSAELRKMFSDFMSNLAPDSFESMLSTSTSVTSALDGSTHLTVKTSQGIFVFLVMHISGTVFSFNLTKALVYDTPSGSDQPVQQCVEIVFPSSSFCCYIDSATNENLGS